MLKGLDWGATCGLPNGNVGFSSKDFVVSAEKAWRKLLTCACISGIGQEGAQASKTRICLTKKSRASRLMSGSGQVIATYKIS